MPRIIKGVWLDKNDMELKQDSNGFCTAIHYGETVRTKIVTENVLDTDKATVSICIKAQIAGQSAAIKGLPIVLDPIPIKDNQAISKAIYLELDWYNEAAASYNYKTHQTELNPQDALTLVFDAKLSNHTYTYKNLPRKKIDKLKPISYRRNYEELLGLFHIKNKSRKYKGKKHQIDNYENHFIGIQPALNIVLDEFRKQIYQNRVGAKRMQAAVLECARKLWDIAVQQAQTSEVDDRPLYWARNKMSVLLKRHPRYQKQVDILRSTVRPKTELAKLLQLLEEESRNYTNIAFATKRKEKKVLITGFDPFILNAFNHPDFVGNILQSNPSGCVALQLHNTYIANAHIQAMIVPVRYTDFDGSQSQNEGQGEGIIEQYITPWIKEVDMIVTISQSLPNHYDIDVFATATRGGFVDNKNYTRIKSSHALPTKREWIMTTLPEQMSKPRKIKFNWEYNRQSNRKKKHPAANEKLESGSGGNYLSNEIFYRVAKLREEMRPQLPTGHFHISKLQDKGEDLSHKQTQKLIKIVKRGLEAAIKSLD